MAEQKVQVCAIRGMTLAIIVQCVNLTIRKRYSPKAVAPAIVSVSVLVQIVPQMKHIVNRIFTCRIPICIEESKGVIAARIHGKSNLGDQIMSLRRSFRTAYRALEVRIADTELIVVLSIRPQFFCLNLFLIIVRACIHHAYPMFKDQLAYLQRVVYIRASICCA